MRSFKANLVDIINRKIEPVALTVTGNIITDIATIDPTENLPYILPGFIDAHIHIESSMLIPSEFARLAVVHGTVATVSDPHEIANVLGVEGVRYMIENGKKVPFHFNFGAPSCVPATNFETAGATLDVDAVEKLLQLKEVGYLAEMMNWPGVLQQDPEVMKKIALAKKYNKPVDGHAPGLLGKDAENYINAGISTDHECFTLEEAQNKLKYGMKVIIREGSAARNFDALHPLIDNHYNSMMFCSDDKHPDELVLGHINLLVKRAITEGHDVFKVLQMACINPVQHYKIEVGQLKVGDKADFILVDTLKEFNVLETWVDGKKVADNGKSLIDSVEEKIVNKFIVAPITPRDVALKANSEERKIKVIVPKDGELVTDISFEKPSIEDGFYKSDTDRDILKIVVVNRYEKTLPAVAFIKNFGFRSGAIASSVAHDSHNIIAVGVEDEMIAKAINQVIAKKGGVSAVDGDEKLILPLPVAGLMSQENGYEVAKKYAAIDTFAKKLGSTLRSPFMTLSFMALLVIPSLKLSDKGLFDGNRFSFTTLNE